MYFSFTKVRKLRERSYIKISSIRVKAFLLNPDPNLGCSLIRIWLKVFYDKGSFCEFLIPFGNMLFPMLTASVADPGCLSRIRLFSIPDPHQRI
jgi:hypothetical protein